MNKRMTEAMMEEFAQSIKIGLVATIDQQHEPHITVLSTLMGKNPTTLMLGKFCEGLSKEHIQNEPKCGFLIMNPQKVFWYGKMTYASSTKEGDDYTLYNNQPLYRYNAYFGINTVYYFNLKEISDDHVLPMGTIIMNALKVMVKKHKFVDRSSEQVMKPWAQKFTSKLDTLLFLSYIDQDDHPVIVPIIQAQSAGSSRIMLKNAPYTELLSPLVKDQKIAILAFSMSMETVLLKGRFSGFDIKGYGYMDIERVYNSMPPVHGYVYPEVPIEAVKFERV
ncbi:MAG: hypothetical protein PHW40_01610 [Candidatus Izemoplasmatales bacterium]|nr:hypothetical protein [Candidatus Izemoplasmatales bacterium]MDD5292992.1 hypothetical protein [Candidatus Izemoplasmatales bacterium]